MSNINLHTCEKAAPGWQNKCKPCAECESEIRRRKMAADFCRSETVGDFEKRNCEHDLRHAGQNWRCVKCGATGYDDTPKEAYELIEMDALARNIVHYAKNSVMPFEQVVEVTKERLEKAFREFTARPNPKPSNSD
jgi:transposase-like protein